MHREFKELLVNAEGISEYVIVINLDIRGFTGFCQAVDSVNVATFISIIYQKIIDQFFPDAKYFKPTGDGLIIIIPYTREDLVAKANKLIKRS